MSVISLRFVAAEEQVLIRLIQKETTIGSKLPKRLTRNRSKGLGCVISELAASGPSSWAIVGDLGLGLGLGLPCLARLLGIMGRRKKSPAFKCSS